MDIPINDGRRGLIYQAQMGARHDIDALVQTAFGLGQLTLKKRLPLARIEKQMEGYEQGAMDWTIYLRRTGFWVDQGDNVNSNVPVIDFSHVILEWGDGPVKRTQRVEVSYPGVAVHVSGSNFRAYFDIDIDATTALNPGNLNTDDFIEATVCPGRPSEARWRRTIVAAVQDEVVNLFVNDIEVPEFAIGLRVFGSWAQNATAQVPIDWATYGGTVLWYNQSALFPLMVSDPYQPNWPGYGAGPGVQQGYGSDGVWMPPAVPAKYVGLRVTGLPNNGLPTYVSLTYEWLVLQ